MPCVASIEADVLEFYRWGHNSQIHRLDNPEIHLFTLSSTGLRHFGHDFYSQVRAKYVFIAYMLVRGTCYQFYVIFYKKHRAVGDGELRVLINRR